MSAVPYFGRGGGSSGGGSSSSSAVRTPDNLRSLDAFEVILGLGEGEWDSCEAFLIGDTYLNNADGSSNFSDVNLYFYPGDADPTYTIIPTLGGVSRGVSVNVQFFYNVPIVRTTQTTNIDYIDIRLNFSQLYLQNDSGVYNSSCTFNLELKLEDATTWTNPYGGAFTITGKTTSTYVKQLRIPVARSTKNYNIRITKLTAESDTTHFVTVGWEGFEEVTNSQYKWPNTVIAHLTGRASDQFTSMPQFSGIYRGSKVKVPTNYDPVARTYTGVWDGTFKFAWTNNPVWCLYDYVTNERYGLSTYSLVNLDKYSAYEAAQWCDDTTSNGLPRYTFNQLIADARSSREQAVYMAGVFNGVFFDDQDGTVYIKVDKQEDAKHLFAEENTIDGFNYTFSDLTTRYNDITVSFTNPALDYQTDRRRVYNQEDIDQNGRVTLDFIAVGCDNEDEAIRRAAYKLLTGLTEYTTVTFKTNRKGMFVQLWEIILIADDTLGYSVSGRVMSTDNSRTIITVRDSVYFEVGGTYSLVFDYKGSTITRKVVNPITGGVKTIILDKALPADLPEYCTFSITGGDFGLPKPFRVIKTSETEGNPDSYDIIALEVNRNKWIQIDNYNDTSVISYSALSSPLVVPGPSSCTFNESFVRSTKEFHLLVEPTLDRNRYKYYSGGYEVWSRLANTSNDFVQRSLFNNDTVINHPPGYYEFKILPASYVGTKGTLNNSASYYYEVTNPSEPPPGISNLVVVNNYATWDYLEPPLDFAGFEIRYQLGGTPNWSSAAVALSGQLVTIPSFNLDLLPAGVKVLLIKAVDYFGIYSEVAGTVAFDFGDPVLANVVIDIDLGLEGFPGVKTNCVVNSSGSLVSQFPGEAKLYLDIKTARVYTGVGSNRFYTGDLSQLPITYIAPISIDCDGYLTIVPTLTGGDYTLSYAKLGTMKKYTGVASTRVYTGVGSNLVYSAERIWVPATNRAWVTSGNYEVRFTTPTQTVSTVVKSIKCVIDVDDVIEYINGIDVPIEGVRLPLTKSFTKILSVHCTLIYTSGSPNAASVVVIDDNPSGPLVKVRDFSGSATTGKVNAIVQGYFK